MAKKQGKPTLRPDYTMEEWMAHKGYSLSHLENARRALLRDWQAELEQRKRIVAHGGKADVKYAEEQVALYERLLRGEQA